MLGKFVTGCSVLAPAGMSSELKGWTSAFTSAVHRSCVTSCTACDRHPDATAQAVAGT
jgi:hypothetical protein